MEQFNFDAPAEVFAVCRQRGKSQGMFYRKFVRGADAVQHVMEVLDSITQKGAVIETDEARFDAKAIIELYQSAAYPLARTLVVAD